MTPPSLAASHDLPIDPAQPPLASDSRSRRRLVTGWLLVAALLAPVTVAIWTVPGFSTQDGPAHLYNAWILAHSFDAESPYRPFFQVHWQPLPNWAGHLALAVLVRLVTPATADRLMITVTLLGFAGSLVWLRWRIRGSEALAGSCVFIACLTPNFLWLMGFSSFLLGCCLFPITIGVWWGGRDRPGVARMLSLAALLVLGYFCHLASLGLTVIGLAFLAAFAPPEVTTPRAWRSCASRLSRTALCLAPLVALLVVYLRLSRQGGPMQPHWPHLASLGGLSVWTARLGWVDPLTLSRKVALPFTERTSPTFAILAPVLWLGMAGLSCLEAKVINRLARWQQRSARGERIDTSAPEPADSTRTTRRVWLALGVLFILGGVLGPDSLGPGHGEYLPQRPFLLGLAALVPALDFPRGARWGRQAIGCLGIALALQTVIVWDYAWHCQRTAAQFPRAAALAGRNQRIAPLLTAIRSRFRANPLMHADCWLGIATGNILWSNYETRYYYFPVQFQPGLDRTDPKDYEYLSLLSDPRPAPNARGCGNRSSPATTRRLTGSWPGNGSLCSTRSRHAGMTWWRRRATCESSRAAQWPRQKLLNEVAKRQPLQSDREAKNYPRPRLAFLRLLQLEEIHLVGHRLEILGPVMTGHGNRDHQLLAFQLVDRLASLALGLLGTFRDGNIQRGMRLGVVVQFHLADILHPVDVYFNRLALERPLGVQWVIF